MELTGVGRKVADCVLLFGFAHDGCVPVDTHCLQLAGRYLLTSGEAAKRLAGGALTPRLYNEITEAWHAAFGAERAGWAASIRRRCLSTRC